MGIEEEAGKAVGGFVSALKDQPLSLALVVMNIALLARADHVTEADVVPGNKTYYD